MLHLIKRLVAEENMSITFIPEMSEKSVIVRVHSHETGIVHSEDEFVYGRASMIHFDNLPQMSFETFATMTLEGMVQDIKNREVQDIQDGMQGKE